MYQVGAHRIEFVQVFEWKDLLQCDWISSRTSTQNAQFWRVLIPSFLFPLYAFCVLFPAPSTPDTNAEPWQVAVARRRVWVFFFSVNSAIPTD